MPERKRGIKRRASSPLYLLQEFKRPKRRNIEDSQTTEEKLKEAQNHETNNPRRALELCADVFEEYPSYPPALFVAGHAMDNLNRLEEGLEFYNMYIDSGHKKYLARAHFNLAVTQEDHNRNYKSAKHHYEMAIKSGDVQHFHTNFYLAQVCCKLGNKTEAKHYYKRVVEIAALTPNLDKNQHTEFNSALMIVDKPRYDKTQNIMLNPSSIFSLKDNSMDNIFDSWATLFLPQRTRISSENPCLVTNLLEYAKIRRWIIAQICMTHCFSETTLDLFIDFMYGIAELKRLEAKKKLVRNPRRGASETFISGDPFDDDEDLTSFFMF